MIEDSIIIRKPIIFFFQLKRIKQISNYFFLLLFSSLRFETANSFHFIIIDDDDENQN